MNVFPRQRAGLLGLWAAAIGTVSWAAPFDPLFQVGKVSGSCLVRRPGVPEFEVAVEQRAYPFGSEIQTRDASDVILHLSHAVQLKLGSGSSAVVSDMEGSTVGAKVVKLDSGILGVYSPDNPDEELPLAVDTPNGRVDNFKGRATLRLSSVAEGNLLSVETAVGDARVNGPQFRIDRMKRSAKLEILTANDESFTGLTGKSGEYEVILEYGSMDPSVVPFKSGARVKIWRRHADVTGRLAVSVMIAGSGDNVVKSFWYLQGESPVQETVQGKEGEPGTPEAVPSGEDVFADVPVVPETGSSADGATPAPSQVPAAQDNIWDF